MAHVPEIHNTADWRGSNSRVMGILIIQPSNKMAGVTQNAICCINRHWKGICQYVGITSGSTLTTLDPTAIYKETVILSSKDSVTAFICSEKLYATDRR